MFNKIKLLACSLEIHVYASVSKNTESCRHHCQQDSLSKTEPKILPCNFYLCNIYCNLNKSNYLFKKLNPII